ncbi:MAG: hypothetical protein MJ252_00090 [archaeon]|nr:hypothetical protein [archaeon]
MSGEIKVKIKQTNAERAEIEVSIQPDLSILELKLKIKEALNIPETKQNLIFKGRILQDNKKIDDYGVSNGDKILLVQKMTEERKEEPTQSVPHVNPQSGVGAPGQINYDLLRQPMGGANINIDQMTQLLQNPEISSQLNAMLEDPNVINAMLDNPAIKPLLDANPMLRQQFSDPNFLRTIMSPENLRMLSQLQGNLPMMGNPYANMGMFGNPTGANQGQTGQGTGSNPAGGMNPNPFMMNPFMMNPYMMNPYMMNPYMMGMNNMNNPNPNPQSTQSPQMTDEQLKEKYKDQLNQLKDMGFTDEENNLKALKKSNGSVQIAIERLLDGNL